MTFDEYANEKDCNAEFPCFVLFKKGEKNLETYQVLSGYFYK